ncbi:ribonuclease E inhibitor RraB, partial [Capnocytophaga sputigena]
ENNPESHYVLNFSREDHIEHIEKIIFDLIELSLQFNGYYDGWGCNVIK